MADSYPQLKENTIRVYKHRAKYDYKTIHSILSSTLFSTVSFVITDEDGEPAPFSLPMTAVAGQYDPSSPLPEDDGSEAEYVLRQESCQDQPFDVYLHGNSAMMLAKMAGKGSLKVVISSTKVDGVILHFAPNGHSLNYRSSVIHGTAVPIQDPAEKHYAMHLLTNHMVRRRWSTTNPVAPEAMKSLQLIKVVVNSASAKVRATNLNGLEKAGLGERKDVWTGALPVFETIGEPVASGHCPERPAQKEVIEWREGRNLREREYAETAANHGVVDATEVVAKKSASRARP